MKVQQMRMGGELLLRTVTGPLRFIASAFDLETNDGLQTRRSAESIQQGFSSVRDRVVDVVGFLGPRESGGGGFLNFCRR
jgi:hypothetical protein